MSCTVCAGYSSQDCPCCGKGAGVTDCPDCGGTGEGAWKVWDIIDRVIVDCTEIAYQIACNDEDEAAVKGKRFCKLSDTCPTCRGTGQVMQTF